MRRLLQYMAPYKWGVAFALSLALVVTVLELAPPLIFKRWDRQVFHAIRGRKD
jgi:hypothetical protein